MRAIEQGYPQREIQNSAYEYQKAIETEDLIIVGVNKYHIEEPAPTGLLKIDSSVEISQKAKLKQLRETRDNMAVKKALEELTAAAKTSDNLMPKILNAVKVYATLGETINALKEVFGEYQENIVL